MSDPYAYYWEDFVVGQIRQFGAYQITANEIVAFAKSFDPLPHHVSEFAAKRSALGVHCASGIHLLGIAQKLICDEFLVRASIVAGRGVDAMRIHRPVLPGEILQARLKLIGAEVHKYKADRGWVDFEMALLIGEHVVMDYKTNMLFLRKPVSRLDSANVN